MQPTSQQDRPPYVTWEVRAEEDPRHRDRVVGEPEGPIDDARLRAFEVVREEIDAAGGVLPFETCSSVTRSATPADAPATFTASFRTRGGGVYRATLIEEHEVVRLAAIGRP